MEEWSAELGKNYRALGSFRAIYTAVSPTAEEPLQGFIIEDRDSGGCLVKMHSAATGGGTVWWLPDEGGKAGGTFAKFGKDAFKVQGLAELTRRYDDLVFLGQQRANRPHQALLVPAIHLGEDTISIFLASNRANQPPALSQLARPRVEEIRELADSVEFVLEDGSWLRLHRETGLLAGQGYPNEKGERSLRLEAVEPLVGTEAFRKEIPKMDPTKIQEASVEELRLADVLHVALFRTFVTWKGVEGGPPLDQLLAENPDKLRAYWQAAWGDRPPPGIPPNVIKRLQDLKGQKKQFQLEWVAAKEAHPLTMKDVSFPQFFRQRRMKLRRDLRKKIEAEALQLPAIAHLHTLLDGEISKLSPDQLARGRQLAGLLVQSQRDGMVIAILPPVTDEDLDKF